MVCTKSAQSLQSLHHAHFVHTLLSANIVCIKSANAHLVHKFNRDFAHTRMYAKLVCIKSAYAHFLHTFYADFMHTQECRLKQCALSLQLHTFCRHCKRQKIVCIKSAYAYFMQNDCIQYANFLHAIECISYWFQADSVLEQQKCHTNYY